jgi:hypothetical protein
MWLYSPNRALASYRAGLLIQRPTPNLEDQVSVLMTPETGWPSYIPRHWVPILVAFCDMQGLQWDYSLIPATTRDNTSALKKVNRIIDPVNPLFRSRLIIYLPLCGKN